MRRLLKAGIGVLLCVAALPASPQRLQRHDQGRVEFPSFTPGTMFDLARERRNNWRDQTIWGELTLPKETGEKVPAVVLMHGSAGVEKSMAQWVDALGEIGVAAFVVDSFGPRGVKGTAEDQRRVPYSANVADAFSALQLLASHPRIDAGRIGVMGFSRGGSVAFQTALEPLRQAMIKTDLKFALHISLYGGCNQVYWSPRLTGMPLLNLVGADDDWTTPAPCEELTRRYARAGTPVQTIRYAGAAHSWDGMYGVFRLEDAVTGAPCGVVRWDIDTWKITAEQTGATLDPAKLDEFFNRCSRRGVHAGRNEEAFRQSRKDVQRFILRSAFGKD